MAKTYKIGFARPALIKETVMVAQLFSVCKNWQGVKQRIDESNLLQTRTIRTSSIVFGEIRKRLRLLNNKQIELIAEDFLQDVRQLVWVAICKQYPFIGDFTIEVLTTAFTSGRYEVTTEDYSHFFNSKAEWHPEIEQVSDKTRLNAQQALFQMMRQCELINDASQLIPQMLSSAIQNCSPESDLAYIPGAMRL